METVQLGRRWPWITVMVALTAVLSSCSSSPTTNASNAVRRHDAGASIYQKPSHLTTTSSTVSTTPLRVNAASLPAPTNTTSTSTTTTVDSFAGSADKITLLDGSEVTLATLKGNDPVLLWFVADGCASCAASIPAVASHLGVFSNAKVQILVLGIFGSFDSGSQGLSELADFGVQAAGSSFTNPAWAWAMASESLTKAYDPDGNPDEYFLLDTSGHLAYRNSVPVSTMDSLLANVKKIAGT